MSTRYPDNACLLIGGSTTRAGFDESILNSAFPRFRFFNAGSNCPNVKTYEAKAMVLRRYRVRPRCVVVPLHAWLLREAMMPFDDGYTDLLTIPDTWRLTFSPAAGRDKITRELVLNTALPTRRWARQLSRIVRDNLYHFHRLVLTGSKLTRSDYEILPNDIRPDPEFPYPETGRLSDDLLDAMIAERRDGGFFDEKRYGGEDQVRSLNHAFALLKKQADVVIVVIMPECDYVAANLVPFAQEPFNKILERHRGKRFRVVDFSNLISDEDIRDLAHALPSGRAKLSNALAAELKMIFAPGSTE